MLRWWTAGSPLSFFRSLANQNQLLKHLSKHAGKTLVVSPFVTKGMLEILDDRLGEKKGGILTLVSNENELRKLGLDLINGQWPEKYVEAITNGAY
ncbi:hypothetical protein [Brevibacillus porteri]|uniref:hypothetical protein n=1 Tax=Brevibacillus porteri TaxID=2126350 RepID=UPI0036400450